MALSPSPSTESLSPVQVPLGNGRDYAVHFRSLQHLPALMEDAGLSPGRSLVVTDENVAAHYRSPLHTALTNAGWSPRVVVLPPGESTKAPEHLQTLYDTALAWGIDRQTPVLALGGGVIGDLAGFAAATLLRGVPLVQIPTSLIAQVDSAIGGKTGINHAEGKNLIGAFYQPAFVCTDVDVLDTLPQREWTSGMAEVVKHALIADAELFEYLETHLKDVMLRRREHRPPVIRSAVQVKAGVVAEDEREAGRRVILNFGHTFAHAIERVAGYGTFTHGEAVALGMRAGLYLSHHLHGDVPRDRADRLVRAIPVEGDPSTLAFDALYDAMRTDKKAVEGEPRFVVLDRLGHADGAVALPRSVVEQAWRFAQRD
jgi:3-dehydroquinate synthase